MAVDIATQNVTVICEPMLPTDTAPQFQRYGYRITKVHGDGTTTEMGLTGAEAIKVIVSLAQLLQTSGLAGVDHE